MKLVFITIYKFNYILSFSILLYLIDSDRPFFWFAKEVITYDTGFVKDTIFFINCNDCYLIFIFALSLGFTPSFLPFLSCYRCYLFYDFTTTISSWH